MPQLLTRKQYAHLFGISRQAVSNAITRKRLTLVTAPVQEHREMIVVDDDKYEEAVKRKQERDVDSGTLED
jgi:predicted transcriptional regulator